MLPHERYDRSLADLAADHPQRYRYVEMDDHVYIWFHRSLDGERVVTSSEPPDSWTSG